MSSLYGVWHRGGALWHGPTLCEGGGGQRPLLRRCLQSPCSALGQCSQVGGLVGLEPPLLVFVRGLKWWLQLQLQYSSVAVSGTVGHRDLLGGPVYLWIVM